MLIKKNKKNINYLFFIIGFIVLFILIVLISNIGKDESVFTNFKGFLTNLNYVLKKPIKNFTKGINVFKNHIKISEENELLKIDIMNKEIINDKNNELESEIAELKELLNLNKTYVDYKIINSTVITRDNLYWFNNITIDKGSTDGINIGDAVVTSQGLIGKIISVSKKNSIVKLITSKDEASKISVGVKSKEGYLHGTIINYENNLLIVEGITNYAGVNINSKVVTSGLGNFPSGILVGYVEKIESDNYNISKILHVRVNQDINNIKYVAVLGSKS